MNIRETATEICKVMDLGKLIKFSVKIGDKFNTVTIETDKTKNYTFFTDKE